MKPSNEQIRDDIKRILDVEGVYACFIFGSFGTEKFTDESDIDIAVITDLSFCQLGLLQESLSEKLNINVDLVNASNLDGIFKLQIAYRSDIVFCKDDNRLTEFLDDTNYWYKTDYRIWKSWQESEW